MASRLAVLLATWFGCGYSPKAPGTVGSAAAVLIAALLARSGSWHPLWFAGLAAATLPVAIWSSHEIARFLKHKDPGMVVIDEVVGQWISLAGAIHWNWKSALAGFVLFRLFDIWKPPPVRQFERLPGGVGIVADDAMAGLYAGLVLFLAGCFNLV